MEFLSETGGERPRTVTVRYDETGRETGEDGRCVAESRTFCGDLSYCIAADRDGTPYDPVDPHRRDDAPPPPLRRVSQVIFEDYLNYLRRRDVLFLRRVRRRICDG